MNPLTREEQREARTILDELHGNSMIVNSPRIKRMDPAEASRQWRLIKPFVGQVAALAGSGRSSRRMRYLGTLRAIQKIETKAEEYTPQLLEVKLQP